MANKFSYKKPITHVKINHPNAIIQSQTCSPQPTVKPPPPCRRPSTLKLTSTRASLSFTHSSHTHSKYKHSRSFALLAASLLLRRETLALDFVARAIFFSFILTSPTADYGNNIHRPNAGFRRYKTRCQTGISVRARERDFAYVERVIQSRADSRVHLW